MKKLSILALCAIVLVPACGPKKSKKAENETECKEVAMNMPLADNDGASSSFFDDRLDAFVLGDDEAWDSDSVELAQNEEPILSWVTQDDETNGGFQAIYFDFDHYNIRSDQQKQVDANIEKACQVAKSGETVVVEGHACHSAGSKTYNLLISEQRAQEVAHCMESEGVSLANMRVVGRGAEMPVVLGGDKDKQAANRRVEMFSLAT